MRKFSSLFLILLLIVTFSCQRNSETKTADQVPGMFSATVIEAKQTSAYSYFHVFQNNQKFWMATSLLDAKEGDVIYYTDAFEMKDFESKELNKTFDVILFVQDASTSPIEAKAPVTMGKANPRKVGELLIEKPAGGITLAELFSDTKKYNGKEVTIRGMVVKYNKRIMGKNWAHIQDGTEHENGFDLTVTTTDTLAEGNIANFTGTINLNRDFGSGYAYDVIMEEAKATNIEDYVPLP